MWTGGGWTSSWACTCLFCMPSSSASPSWSNTTSSRLSTCPCATRICRPEDFHGFEPKYLQDRPKSPMILLFPLFNLFTELLLLKKTTVSHFTFKPLWFRWKNCISQNTIDSLSLHQFQEMKFSFGSSLYNWKFFHFWTLDNRNATRNCLYWIDNCLLQDSNCTLSSQTAHTAMTKNAAHSCMH